MFHAQGASKYTCSVLVVTCGEFSEDKRDKDTPEDKLRYPFPELVSSGRLEVNIGYYHVKCGMYYHSCIVYWNVITSMFCS